MKPQTSAHLDAADRALGNVRLVLQIPIPDQAARIAYYAQYHAAQTLIFERTDKSAKTHRGVNRKFHRLARSEAGLDPGLPAELSTAYRFKDIADYDTTGASPITQAEAARAFASAERLVLAIRAILSKP